MTFPILPSNAVGGYQVQRSLRFNSADSAYLNRTPSVAGNRKTWTWSGWVKRGYINNTSQYQAIFTGGNSTGSASALFYFGFWDTNGIRFSSATAQLGITTAVFRDPSAWYHIVVAVDTTQAAADNRIKLYVNGVQIAMTVTSLAQNDDTGVNNTAPHNVGVVLSTQYFNGYMTEVNFIDGQALTPSSFGETNGTTGQWQPKKYTGTYGTNGFYLNFSDNSGTTATTLGKDYSGNGNNWTPNNFSVTPGAGNDSMIDVPTNWDDGGNGRGNYCVMNPLDNNGLTVSDGNLSVTKAASGLTSIRSTIQLPSDKIYLELTHGSTPGGLFGFASPSATLSNFPGSDTNGVGFQSIATAKVWYGGAFTNYGSDALAGDVNMLAIDVANKKFWVGKNGTWFINGGTGDPSAGTNPAPYSANLGSSLFFMYSAQNGQTGYINFGQRPFAYTPPSGFKAINTQNIAAGTITTGGTFTGNVNADGPFVWLNGVPTAMTINGNAVTFGTHADKLSNGFKVRSASTSYNNTGSNTYSITTTGARFKVANAQGNP